MELAPIHRDDFSAGFFDAAAAGHLAVRRCENGHFLPPTLGYMGPATRCPECLSAQVDWVPAADEVTLVSWTVVHSKDGSTQIVGLVELAEGPWMTAALDVESDAELAVGSPLRVHFVHPDGGEAIPVFSPA
jgi:uncharacterized OB-fold protein